MFLPPAGRPGSLFRCTRSVLALALLCGAPALSQQVVPAPEVGLAELAESEPEPIPAPEISDRAADTRSMVREILADIADLDDLQTRADAFATEKTRLEGLREDSIAKLEGFGPPAVLAESQKEWLRAESRLDGWSQKLTARADAISALRRRLDKERANWEITRDAPGEAELPPELTQAIGESLDAIAGVREALRSERDETLSLQVKIGEEKTEVQEILAEERDEISRRRRSLVRIDSPPLWAMPSADEASSLGERVKTTWTTAYSAVREYLEDSAPRLVRQLVLFVLLVAALIALRGKARVWAKADHSLESTVVLVERPIATALVVFALFLYLGDPNAPDAWVGVLGLLMLAAGLRLAPKMAVEAEKNWSYPLACLLSLWFVTTVSAAGGALNRHLLLLLSVAGVLTCVWFAQLKGPDQVAGSSRLLRGVQIGNRIAAGLFAAGAISNVVGSVGLAAFITSATLHAASAALVLWLVALVLQGLVQMALLTEAAKKLGLHGRRAKSVQDTLFRAIRWLTVIAWFYAAMTAFLVLEPVLSFLTDTLEAEVPIGQFALAPADLLVFVLVVWLSYKISHLVRFVLDASVYPNVDLPRGAPAAMSTLTHYLVMVAGVLTAFAAAGFDLSRVTIMFGALGVGIGFGLQNIVNNFISGLILLFERPIKVGDVVDLDGAQGVVKDIAIRASIVRTYDGAEIIVPNSELISNRVVNLTYRNDRTRVRIAVGVAHGSDPAQVIELLEQVATGHHEILGSPSPMALFREFGESTLEFELRFWTSWDEMSSVASDIRGALTAVLEEAGIEIPVPKRDVRVRSIAESDRPVEATGK